MAQLNVYNRQLATSATEGIRHLESADWSTSAQPRDEYLALLTLRFVLAGYLVGTVQRTTSDGKVSIAVKLDGRDSPLERRNAARALLIPLEAYANLAGIRLDYYAKSETGAVPIPVLIVGGAVAVSIVAAEAYVLSFAVDRGAQIVDGALRRNDAAKEVQRADAEVIKLVNQHVQREQAAKQTLPLDDATRLAISGLQTRIGTLVKNAYEAEKASNFPAWVFPVAGLAAAAAVAAVMFNKRKQHV